MSHATSVRLARPSAPPWRRWAWRATLLTWAALTVWLVYAKWGTWPRLQVRVLLAQRRCLSFTDQPGRVMLDMGSPHVAELLSKKGYRGVCIRDQFADPSRWRTSAAVWTGAEQELGNMEAACERLARWNELRHPKPPVSPRIYMNDAAVFDSPPSDSLVLYLHGLRAGPGPERLVVLRADEDGGVISLYTSVLAPTGLTGEVKNIAPHYRGDGGPVTALGQEGLRVFAGKLDPADPARFTLDFEKSAGRGTIEVRLLPDDQTDLKIISVPAAGSDIDRTGR